MESCFDLDYWSLFRDVYWVEEKSQSEIGIRGLRHYGFLIV